MTLIRTVAVGFLLGISCRAVGAETFSQDFRNGQLDRRVLSLVGKQVHQFAALEKAGLRITQAKPDQRLEPVGCQTRFSIHGDFQVTATFEILDAPKPRIGFGNGVTLRLVKAPPEANAATLAWFNHPERGEVFVADDERSVGDKREHKHEFFPTSAKAGKLRIARTGSQVRFSIAEDGEGAFREVKQIDFGTEDIQMCRIAGVTGMAPMNLDVRFTELSITADDLPLPESGEGTMSLWWIWLGVNVVGLSAIGYFVYRRWRRNRPVEAADPKAAKPVKTPKLPLRLPKLRKPRY
jgi:LPXTG-motif cell wall-anchored protein